MVCPAWSLAVRACGEPDGSRRDARHVAEDRAYRTMRRNKAVAIVLEGEAACAKPLGIVEESSVRKGNRANRCGRWRPDCQSSQSHHAIHNVYLRRLWR